MRVLQMADLRMHWLLILIVVDIGIIIESTPACNREIWCTGNLLRDVQMADIFPDSKTFVDMNIKTGHDVVLSAYANLSRNGTPSKLRLKLFVDTYFSGPGKEFVNWTPDDYVENPTFLKKIKDERLRYFGSKLCERWTHLGRKIRSDVRTYQERFSLIYLENPFIVPGGRFREIYYWDSYWVIQGLLTCEMTSTVKGMLENLISFVKRFGLVPNGGRVYYLGRSQPPLLTPMVDLYMKATGDKQFLQDNIGYLVKEYDFWTAKRQTTVKNYSLNRYAALLSTPRPESYREDFKLGGAISYKGGSKELFYANIASAAESGWDFSTRWFKPGYKNKDKTMWLQDIDTMDIVPVDLNSILCWNEKLLSEFYNTLGDQAESSKWLKRHGDRVRAMYDVFWDSDKGSWFDYRISSGQRTKDFYPSSVFPLFTGCIPESETKTYTAKILNYLQENNVTEYVSGVPTSLIDSGQQWDFPNAWPPLQHVIITSLAKDGNRTVALDLAQKWMNSNYIGWRRTGGMFEKYDVTEKGSRGGGGEYNVQEGFGWTNGVILDLLDKFGEELSVNVTSGGMYIGAVIKIPMLFICFLACFL